MVDIQVEYSSNQQTRNTEEVYEQEDKRFLKTPVDRNDNWKHAVKKFNDEMQRGLDVGTLDEERREKLRKKYDVKTYECEWNAVIKCKECPR